MLLLDTGDALIGYPEFSDRTLGDQTEGEAVVAGMNLLGYDATAIGPKELTLGPETLQRRIDEAEFPVLSANVVLSETGELLAPPYAVLDVAGRRLGVIGLTREPEKPSEGFHVVEPLAALQQYATEVAQEAETVILITNLEYDTALSLVSEVAGIDLAIAALPERIPPKPELAAGTNTMIVTAERPTRGHSGRHVGILNVIVEPDGSLTQKSWTVRSLDPSIEDDTAMASLLEQFKQ